MKMKWLCAGSALALILCTALFLPKKSSEEAGVKKITAQQAADFLRKNRNESDLPVFDPIEDSEYQFDDIDEGDFIQHDEQYLYIVDYERLNIIDINSKECINEIRFEDFMPSEIILTSEYIVLIGIRSIVDEIEVLPGRKFPYSSSECGVFIVSKSDFSLFRSVFFAESYYLSSAVYQDALYLALSDYTIFNPESKTFIFPSYQDSIYRDQKLSEEDLYLSEAGQNAFSIRLIAKITLKEIRPMEFKGILGVEGMPTFSEKKILMSSSLYEEENKTAIHVFAMETLTYEGSIVLDGYLTNSYALSCYGGYLRAATCAYENNASHNYLYNVSLSDYTVKAKRSIAPNESIYAIRFDKNYCYLSTFLYVDPLCIYDFSDPSEIKETKEAEVEFSCDYLELTSDYLFALGTSYDEEMISDGLVLALFDKEELTLSNVFQIDEKYANTEVRYNQKALVRKGNTIYFPMFGERGQSVQIFSTENPIYHKKTLTFPEDYILRIVVTDHYVLCISSTQVYYYSIHSYAFVSQLEYRKIDE